MEDQEAYACFPAVVSLKQSMIPIPLFRNDNTLLIFRCVYKPEH